MDNLFASLGFARSHRSLQRGLLLLWVLLVSGCVVNPVTGKTELAALPDAQIEAQAAEQYGAVVILQRSGDGRPDPVGIGSSKR